MSEASDETDVPVPQTGQVGVVLSQCGDGAGRDGLDPGAEPHGRLRTILGAELSLGLRHLIAGRELAAVTEQTGCLPPCRYSEVRMREGGIETRHQYENQATIALVKLSSSTAVLKKDITKEIWDLAEKTAENLSAQVKSACN